MVICFGGAGGGPCFQDLLDTNHPLENALQYIIS
jgi:hypothetical protein